MAKTSISEKIDLAILKAKNLPPKKSVELVLSVCEDILSKPIDHLSVNEKETLLGVVAQYTMMKKRYSDIEKIEKNKKNRER